MLNKQIGKEHILNNSVFSNRNLQLYFSGQFVSMVGTWMQQMAMSWLVYRMTDSVAMLGIVGFTSQIPVLFLTPFAGIIADRVNRHRLVIITQALSMVQAAVLAVLVLTGSIQLWQLIALSAVLGIIGAFDLPIRQTFLLDMLESKEQLPRAIAINSSITTVTRLIGPFFAGLFIAWAGEGMCFLVNALSYAAVIIALLFVKSKQQKREGPQQRAMTQMKEGFVYTFTSPHLRVLIIFLALIGLFSIPFTVLMPAFAKDVFHGDASTLGFLTAASGIGSIIGALFIGSRKDTEHFGKYVLAGCAFFGLGLIIFGFSKSFILSLCMLAIVGCGSMMLMAACNTLIQTMAETEKRGRVMSILIVAFIGLTPFGCMAAGELASKIGTSNTVIGLGIFTLSLAFVFASTVGKIKPAQISSI